MTINNMAKTDNKLKYVVGVDGKIRVVDANRIPPPEVLQRVSQELSYLKKYLDRESKAGSQDKDYLEIRSKYERVTGSSFSAEQIDELFNYSNKEIRKRYDLPVIKEPRKLIKNETNDAASSIYELEIEKSRKKIRILLDAVYNGRADIEFLYRKGTQLRKKLEDKALGFMSDPNQKDLRRFFLFAEQLHDNRVRTQHSQNREEIYHLRELMS